MDKLKRPWRLVHSEASTGWGGQEHRILAELIGFHRRGCEVALLAPSKSGIFKRASAVNIPVRAVEYKQWKFPFAAVRLARWLRKKRVQILNPHSSRDGWLLGVAGRLARTPLIIRTRHIDVEYPSPRISRHAFTTFADHVLTTSNRITSHFQEIFHLPDDRITTLPTGIDLTAFTPVGEKADVMPPNGKRPLVGMVSVLRSWKGHPVFVEAASKMIAAGFPGSFVIVGEGSMRRPIEKQIADLGLGNRFNVAGHREDVPAVLRALDVLVIPSTKNEGVPQIGLQALAVGTPVVGSDVGGIPEIIQPGKTGRIFPSGDAAALASAIGETLADEKTTRANSERGRKLVEANHSLDAMLDKLDALYARYLEQ